jgi:hypothetical protein
MTLAGLRTLNARGLVSLWEMIRVYGNVFVGIARLLGKIEAFPELAGKVKAVRIESPQPISVSFVPDYARLNPPEGRLN